MCGIFGYIGYRNAVHEAIEGLKKLEYRGYDSAGIAGLVGNRIEWSKTVGKVSMLEAAVAERKLELDLAIAHTRWATHGVPNESNAHPHLDASATIAIVHNGIIENSAELRSFLEKNGVKFASDTDSEVIAHLLHYNDEVDFLEAIRKTLPMLQGAFAVACINNNYPGKIFAMAHSSPLAVGLGQKEAFISSDPHAFICSSEEVFFLSNKEIAVVTANGVELFNASMQPIERKGERINFHVEEVSKGDFPHFTLKEIYEQPQALRQALAGRIIEGYGSAAFDELVIDPYQLMAIERVLIIACGSSLHAGYLAKNMMEDQARIPVDVEIASEFRYRNPVVSPKTLVIAISQSGETADTLAAMREVQAKGVKVIAICNVEASTMGREADAVIFLRAGKEVGVCSTKAFVNQVAVLALLSLLMARMRHMTKAQGLLLLQTLRALPGQIEQILANVSAVELMAKRFASFDHAFFLGRNYMFPTSLEGALKLKEIAYVNATGYPAGEMKHGPIALISPNCLTIALCTNALTYDKFLSNLMEVRAREGPILAIAWDEQKAVAEISQNIIYLPKTCDEFAPILTTVVLQLFAYFMARERGADIDQPRNLAKSVTVE